MDSGTAQCNIWIANKTHEKCPTIQDFVTGCYTVSVARKYIKEYLEDKKHHKALFKTNYQIFNWKTRKWINNNP